MSVKGESQRKTSTMRTLISVNICNRMAPLRIVYSVTLTSFQGKIENDHSAVPTYRLSSTAIMCYGTRRRVCLVLIWSCRLHELRMIFYKNK